MNRWEETHKRTAAKKKKAQLVLLRFNPAAEYQVVPVTADLHVTCRRLEISSDGV